MRVRVLVCDTAVVIFHYVVGDAPSRFVGVRVGLNFKRRLHTRSFSAEAHVTLAMRLPYFLGRSLFLCALHPVKNPK